MSLSSDITVSMISPLSISSLLLSLFSLFQYLMLQVVSVDVSVTFLSLAFFASPSLSQTVDWYGDTRLCVFLALPQMGPWQHVRDQNVLYLSCQVISLDQNGSRPLSGGCGEAFFSPHSFSSTHQIEVLIAFFDMPK